MLALADRDILYLALTRPALKWGCPVEGVFLNILVCFLAGTFLQAPTIWRSPMMFWLAVVPIHFVMQRRTARDYHWARTLRLWLLSAAHPTLYSLPVKPAAKSGLISAIIGEHAFFARRTHA